MKEETATTCVFSNNTLHGKKQGRLFRGYVSATLLEPIYMPTKAGDLFYQNITHRQVYVRDSRLDTDGALGFRLEEVIPAVPS